jgi:CheY-like chemotaxis protein
MSDSKGGARIVQILAIDYEELIRDTLSIVLSIKGYDVTTVDCGSKDISCFEKNSYGLVITDLDMPEMSGWDVIRAIRSIDPTVPVVLATGWAGQIDQEKLRENRVNVLLSKPFDMPELMRAVDQALQSKERV